MSRALLACCACVSVGDAQRLGEPVARRRELQPEAVDLLVLGSRDVALLRQQRLLEAGQRLPELLPRRHAAARDLVAQLAFDALRLGPQQLVQFVAEAAPGSGIGPAQREPCGHQQQQRQQRRREPFESHPRLSQRPTGAPATGFGGRTRAVGKKQCVPAVG